MKHLLFTLPLALFVLASCGGESSNDEKDGGNSTGETKDEVVKKTCKITSMSFKLGDKDRVLQFEYKEGGDLSKVETIVNGEDQNQTMSFNYHENGKLQAFLSGSMIAAYVYDDNERILKINGESGLNTRSFEYNDQDQISKQVTEFGGKPYMTHEYKYDANGQPTEVSVFNKAGELTEVNTIKYDDKINPFVNKGVSVNSMEMMLGYPVGNQTHNITSITKVYQKKSSYQINGAYKQPGDMDVNEIEYTYNENGYPISMSRLRKGEKSTMTLEYNCD